MLKAPESSVTRRRQPLAVFALAFFTTLASAGPSNDVFYSSFETGQPSPIASSANAAFGIQVAGGPSAQDAYSAKPGVGFTGLHSLHYYGNAGGKQEAAMFDVDVPVSANTQLSYLLFPCAVTNDLRDPSTYIAVDLIFDDGTRLSGHAAQDQHRIAADAHAQGESRTLYVNQWNKLSIDVGRVAAGRRIRHIMLMHNGPAAHFEGFLDDLRIGPATEEASDPHPSDLGRNAPRHELQQRFLARQQLSCACAASWLQFLDACNRCELRLDVPVSGAQRRQQSPAPRSLFALA